MQNGPCSKHEHLWIKCPDYQGIRSVYSHTTSGLFEIKCLIHFQESYIDKFHPLVINLQPNRAMFRLD